MSRDFWSFIWFGFRSERIRIVEEIQRIYRRHQLTESSEALLDAKQEFEQTWTLHVNSHRHHSLMME
jgi:hypothetical protein